MTFLIEKKKQNKTEAEKVEDNGMMFKLMKENKWTNKLPNQFLYIIELGEKNVRVRNAVSLPFHKAIKKIWQKPSNFLWVLLLNKSLQQSG